MKLSSNSNQFLSNLMGSYKIKKGEINIFNILSYFVEKGDIYLTTEGKAALNFFGEYKEFFKKNISTSLTKNKYDEIMMTAATIASKSLSVKIEINHLILSALKIGISDKKLPLNLYKNVYPILGNKNSVVHQYENLYFPAKKNTGIKIKKGIKPFDFENELLKKVYLNKNFTKEISDFLMLKYMNLDLKPYLPNGIFLFVGNKSTGKSELAYSIAEVVMNSREDVSEMDLSMLTQMMSIQSEEDNDDDENNTQFNIFKEMIKNNREKVFLLKHIEFLSKKLFYILTQIFSKGYIFVEGKKISFDNSIFIITLDKHIVSTMTKKIGFQNTNEEKNKIEIKELLIKQYSEDFISLFDGIYIFNDITVEDYKEIFKRKLEQIKTQVQARGFNTSFSTSIIDYLANEYYKEIKLIPDQISSFLEKTLMIPFLDAIKKNPNKKNFKFTLSSGKLKIN